MNPGMNNFDYQDKMSESDFDSDSELSRFSNLQIYQKNNAEIIRKFFNVNVHYEDEEDLILDIMKDNTIDWNEISSRSRIPGIILYEFQTKIIWINVIYNTRLTKKSIIENKNHLLNEFRNNIRVFNNVNDTNFSNILQILKTIYDYDLITELYKSAYDKKYVNLVRSMLKLSMINKKDINFEYYLKNNNSEIVRVIIEETDLRPTQKDLSYAIQNNHYQMVGVIIDKTDLRPTQKDLSYAIQNNHYQMVGVIIDKTDLRITQEEFTNSINNNRYQMVGVIIDKTDLRPSRYNLKDAITNNHYQMVGVIIDKTDLILTHQDLINAINCNCHQTVETIINKTDLRPSQNDLENITWKSYDYQMHTVLRKYNCF